MIGRTRARVTAAIAAVAGLTAPAGLLFSGAASAAGSVHRFNHVVIVVMENKKHVRPAARRGERERVTHYRRMALKTGPARPWRG